MERQGYHVVKPIDPQTLIDLMSQFAAHHNFLMTARAEQG